MKTMRTEKINVEIDPSANAKYIYLKEFGRKVHKTKSFETENNYILVDEDENGTIIGIEIIELL